LIGGGHGTGLSPNEVQAEPAVSDRNGLDGGDAPARGCTAPCGGVALEEVALEEEDGIQVKNAETLIEFHRCQPGIERDRDGTASDGHDGEDRLGATWDRDADSSAAVQPGSPQLGADQVDLALQITVGQWSPDWGDEGGLFRMQHAIPAYRFP
jgi:hypothetical protein